ncbi:sensor histidine kinase [Actinomadura yumaensis]|uniref:histidine kinase n=1 Tax=Actinomadura yumaensis TaxID=111807 RepID=A0ABW2CWV6_9ACTN
MPFARAALRRVPTTRQDVLIALATLAGGALVLLAHGYARWTPSDAVGLGWRFVPLLGLAAMVPFRRTAPLLALAAATPFNIADVVIGPSFASAIIYGDALYAASLYRRRPAAEWLLGATVAVTAACAVAAGLALHSVSGAVVTAAIAGVTWTGPVLTAMAVREHRDKAEAERVRAEQTVRLAELDRRGAVSAERARMARELHDVIANHLSAVALHSSAVLKVRDLDREGLDRSMEIIRENSVQGLAEMRRMIGLLRDGSAGAPSDPPAAPRLAELDRLVRRSARSDLTAGLKVAGEPAELPSAVELAAYRIVQESLTNALKHGGPGHAEVLLEYGPRRVVVEVSSPLPRGDGAPRLPGAGAGLIGMRERAAMLDGTFAAGPEDGRWRVRAELPVEVDGRERENTR